MARWDWFDPQSCAVAVGPACKDLEIETLWRQCPSDRTAQYCCSVSVFRRDDCLFTVEGSTSEQAKRQEMAERLRRHAIHRALTGDWERGRVYSV